MKKGQYFMNDETGVITNIHREAVEWYRQGANISIWINGVVVCRWGSLIRKGENENESKC